MSEKKYSNIILVLPSWYPNKLSPYDGDFIKRHVEAISLYQNQTVIYVVKDENGIMTKDVLIEINLDNNITEQIIYYKPIKTGFKMFDKLLSQIKYKRVYKTAITNFIKKNGVPYLTHVHVAYKAGLLGCWIKTKWNIPYLLSEHSTIYLKKAEPNIDELNYYFKQIIKKVINNASNISVVSNYLGVAINNFLPKIKFKLVPNVVNSNIFTEVVDGITLKDNTDFIFISNFTSQKNFPFLVDVIKYLKQINIETTIHCYGSNSLEDVDLVTKYDVSNRFIFYGEVPQKIIAQKMQQVSALLICSKYETFGCVVIEANAAGLPVLATPTKPFDELIENGVNGIVATEFSVEAYAEVIKNFIDKKYVFDSKQIFKSVNNYSYQSVGKQYFDIYNSILSK
ncbi:MAG: glycosyltransferase [Ferruginibacter sp.]|nr:glycosyltransferase [Ferruginibacter sp.]